MGEIIYDSLNFFVCPLRHDRSVLSKNYKFIRYLPVLNNFYF